MKKNNNEILLTNVSNEEFDKVRILMKTIADYGGFIDKNSNELSLYAVIGKNNK